jgi:hypothetical protein
MIERIKTIEIGKNTGCFMTLKICLLRKSNQNVILNRENFLAIHDNKISIYLFFEGNGILNLS